MPIDFFKKQNLKKTVYPYICTAILQVLLKACDGKIPNFKT